MKADDTIDRSTAYNELVQKQYELNVELKNGVARIGDIADSLKDLIVQNNDAIKVNNENIKINNIAISSIEKFMSKLLYLLVIAVIILAGAEKVIQFLK
jgi:hypothetical protein